MRSVREPFQQLLTTFKDIVIRGLEIVRVPRIVHLPVQQHLYLPVRVSTRHAASIVQVLHVHDDDVVIVTVVMGIFRIPSLVLDMI